MIDIYAISRYVFTSISKKDKPTIYEIKKKNQQIHMEEIY